MPTSARPFLEYAEDILSFVVECQRDLVPCARCVVTDVSGGSARSVGTIVAVRADGEMAGYVSHGCVDADLKLQAQETIKDAKPRQLIYGTGSPFIDLRLPCGGRVEILIDPIPNPDFCKSALEQLKNREAVTFSFNSEDGLIGIENRDAYTGCSRKIFSVWHPPRLRLVIAGVGPPMIATSLITQTMGLSMSLLSPDHNVADVVLGAEQGSFLHLTSPQSMLEISLDEWSAVLLLFHDHDWEPSILMAALNSNAFYIGALGSSCTHARRLLNLEN